MQDKERNILKPALAIDLLDKGCAIILIIINHGKYFISYGVCLKKPSSF